MDQSPDWTAVGPVQVVRVFRTSTLHRARMIMSFSNVTQVTQRMSGVGENSLLVGDDQAWVCLASQLKSLKGAGPDAVVVILKGRHPGIGKNGSNVAAFLRMIPLRFRSDSLTFTPGPSAIRREQFFECPL
jgi:hypothetical protein